jgi:hypothetical protein
MTPLYREYFKSMSLVLLCPLWIDLSVGPRLTFPFKLFPNFLQNLVCYYCYIIIFLHFVVRIFVIHCVPQTTGKATVILVNWMVTLWTAYKNTRAYKKSSSFLTFSLWLFSSHRSWLEFAADIDIDICYLYFLHYMQFKKVSQI